MKQLTQTLLFLICLSLVFSCVSRKPLVKQTSHLTKGAILVEPEWRQKKNGVWFVAPLLGAAAGGAYGYHADIFEGLESQEQNVAAYGGAGLVGGLLLAGALSKNSQKGKIVPVRAGDGGQWVRKYNKETVIDYHLLDARDDGRLLLAPEKLAGELRQAGKRHQSLLANLESSETLAWEELATYRDFLQQDYFNFYPEEKKRFNELLVSREADAAFALLHEKMNEIVRQPGSELAVNQIHAFPRNNQSLYNKISPSQRESLGKMRDDYMTPILSELLENLKSKELSDLPMDDFSSAARVEFAYREIVSGDVGKYIGEFARLSVVSDMLNDLKRLKTTIVERNEHQVAANFRSHKDRTQLAEAKGMLLSNLQPTAAVQRLERVHLEVVNNLIAEEKRREEQIRQQERMYQMQQTNALMSEVTATGEPTEAQMRFAMQSQLDAKNKEIAQYGNTRFDKDNPLTFAGAIFGKFVEGTETFLEYFRKISCEKASSKAGFICDYSIKTGVKGGVVGGYLQGVNTGLPKIQTGRFVKSEGHWMLVELMK